MSVYCWYHNPLCESKTCSVGIAVLMHACMCYAITYTNEIEKVECLYTLQTCLTIQIVHPKGISIYDHMYTQFSEGGVG